MPRAKPTGRWFDHRRDLFPPGTQVSFVLGGKRRWGFYRGYHALRGRHKIANKKNGNAGWLVPVGVDIRREK